MSFQDLSQYLPFIMHFAQLCLQIKWLHHGPYCKNTGEIKECKNPYAKTILQAICTACAAGLE